ncbi:MAG: tetrahydrofolate dehydrogenase/cyclohydrolase catalytic domain-containing protein [Clostridium sp.]|nr:tetrahydrofolate dehydrogenase/cyclohydrolase catalytic domain-containing protein [Clostridium sp.]
MGQIINGKQIAEKFREEIKNLVKKSVDEGKRVPSLAIIIVGNDGGSLYYAQNAKKLSEKLGLKCDIIKFNEKCSEESIIETIHNLNTSKDVDGIMVQMPLPDKFNENNIISSLDYKKDIDGLTHISAGRLYTGEECFIPCTPKAIIEIVKDTDTCIEGKRAVIIGRSNIVGKPCAQLLLKENATVTICHSRTKDLQKVSSSADILVCATGKPGFINKDFVKSGAVVIDVGTTVVNGKLTGDVAFDDVKDKCSFITPVPGGVGAVTTTMLLKNTCEAFLKNVY